MVLAAGLGTRLLPLTREIAKPAVPFFNRPLIHHCLEWLERNGIDEVVVNLHYRPRSVISAIEEGSWPLKIHLSYEPDLLGTAGGLKKAEEHFGDETFVMINSDSLFEGDLAAPLSFHRERGAMATMVLRERSPEDPYGTVRIGEEGRIIAIRGGGAPGEGKGYVFTGIHLFQPEILDWIPRGCLCEINRDVYPRLIGEGLGIWGFVTGAFWAEVGSRRTYLTAHMEVLNREGPEPRSTSPLSDHVEEVAPVLAGRDCRVGEGARVGPRAVVGEDCQIGEGAVVEDSVLWNGVRIGPGARVRGSIVGHRTTIEAGTSVEGMAVSGRERVRID
ncbi:MAG: NDP-sugar synthase [Deltaproteobacteria bacterium]|nr:NDP-sugar synthase [Deltaproteobacteria bacterium]